MTEKGAADSSHRLWLAVIGFVLVPDGNPE